MLSNRLILKSNEPEASTGIRVRVFHNLHILHLTILTEESTELVFSQLIVYTSNKHFITSTIAASPLTTLRLLLTITFRTMLATTFTIPPIFATTTTPAIPTISTPALSRLLPLFVLILLRSLRYKETICWLVPIALSNLNIAASNRVSIFLKHHSVQTFALRRIIAVNFKRYKGKAP
jgi:hypothetical protein